MNHNSMTVMPTMGCEQIKNRVGIKYFYLVKVNFAKND